MSTNGQVTLNIPKWIKQTSHYKTKCRPEAKILRDVNLKLKSENNLRLPLVGDATNFDKPSNF